MLKRLVAFLVIPIMLAAFIPCYAAPTPVVPRCYRPEMEAYVGYYNDEKYIVLDINIVDITEPTGLLGIEFDILFDGDLLEPLWQTDAELNGNGITYNAITPPQMVISWPTYTFTFRENSYDVFAVEGLCKAYSKTGKGVLHVSLVTDVDNYEFAVFGDEEIALRLYFEPIGGFKNEQSYTFSIDGKYDETVKQYVTTCGVNNAKPMPGVAYGYGDSTTCTVTWADCGAFDLADTTANIVPDGNKNVLWVDKVYTAKELKALFKGSVSVLSASGGTALADNTKAAVGSVVKTASGSLTVAVKGDINCDGSVSTLDYALLKSALSGDAQLNTLQAKIADISGEGAITTTDAAWFKRLF